LYVPEDYYTTILTATEVAGEGHTTVMDYHDLLYIFEYYGINKIGGTNNPYACAEWPGIQITQTIMSLLDSKGLQFTFFHDKRKEEAHALHFYERNPAGRGLDFDDSPEDKPDFIKYVVELRCLNLGIDTKKTLLPSL
jgi:hypothetical protein